ncbi:inositol monophosphatase family protein [Fodinibius halophilus]|uniref:Inositol monophosphatase family protein n=1 Tax=Fodinibius halophilus TaxID=1736908 RepID=A0A6M1TDH6_9BACT|nr:inositol monophosphatase family protein [Fodinibius halophilus]NGP86740.1 inositol monophosphatase family protein [Fodinibius halophilus]
MNFDLDTIHRAAIEIAKNGGDHTLNYFNRSFDVERKADDSPVTVADREAESIMRENIANQFPDHGIVGEEHGKDNEESSVQWILDPIDGTKSFIHGVPLYTTLIGVVVDDEPVVGVIYAPALDELCDAAQGKGARLNGEECRVRSCDDLAKASFMSTDAYTAAEFDYGDAFNELLDKSRIHRTWGDAYGHMLVATGRADLMFDPILNIWDAAPLLTILREAGGIFSDTDGNETIQSGNGFSCSRELLPDVLEVFEKNT